MMERKLDVISALPEECRERIEARFEGLEDAGVESFGESSRVAGKAQAEIVSDPQDQPPWVSKRDKQG
ncbi:MULTISPECIES: hypothetical protein [Mesorhizobium]|uniref:hypothetical protein n=1 Tax=Mesorhizobium TaxID=68287 RepID=UPI001140CBD2|nr:MULTISPECIES: hypothetical protein [Mesorhizobium]